MKPIRIALTKGRLEEKSIEMFDAFDKESKSALDNPLALIEAVLFC